MSYIKYSTSFDKVCDMNEAFGNPKGNPIAIDIERIKSQCENILDEYNELMEAIDERDIDKIRDALCDIHVFAYGAHHLMGIDADFDMNTVVTAVMSRFVKDSKDLAASIQKHKEKGIIQYYTEGQYPRMVLKSACDQPDAPKGKFLKSASYRQPVFYGLAKASAATDLMGGSNA